MKRTHLLSAAAAIVLVLLVAWYLQPDKRLRRSWHRLIDVVEARHARALGGMLAEDYHDRWGYTRTALVNDARLAFHHFDSLEIEVDQQTILIAGDRATISALLRIRVRGTEQAEAARVAANSLFTPFTFTWVREPSFPWSWRLESFDQPEFDLGRYRRRLSGLE